MIGIIGLGFVGLTTGLGFAEKGNDVIGFDINKNKCQNIIDCNIPFYEPVLDVKLKEHLGKNFTVVDNVELLVKKSKIIFFCVGTPQSKDGSAELGFLFTAIEKCIEHIDENQYKVLVIKSSVPPSTTKNIIVPFVKEKSMDKFVNIGVANNPEFLREGYAWEDFINPDRIVIGCDDNKSGKIIKEIYLSFKARIFLVTLNTAEFIKYLSNSYLANMISFSNELAMIADKIGDIDTKKSFNILHHDKRWSGHPANMTTYLYPGIGFGGYCLPKDTSALIKISEQNGYNTKLLNEILSINDRIKLHIIDKIKEKVSRDSSIGILGLSFKPNSDDVRNTPTAKIIELLLQSGYKKIFAYDPMANDNFKQTYDFKIKYETSLHNISSKVDCILVLTGWHEFIENKEKYNNKLVFDFRYVL